MILRVAGRLIWLAFEISAALFGYFFDITLNAPQNLRAARATWLQRTARAHLKIFGGFVDVSGAIPTSGLLVSNHLSYLDIVVICSITPTVFVSKAEVRIGRFSAGWRRWVEPFSSSANGVWMSAR